MHRVWRGVLGGALGLGSLLAYLLVVGVDAVVERAAVVAPGVVVVVVALVVAEALVDGVGVWASVNPLGRGIAPDRSVQFALAGDFFDTLSPAGPVSSEPIMARFIGVATGTSYGEALAVRTVAKYVKSGSQLLLSVAVGAVVVLGGSSPQFVVLSLAGAAVGLLVAGVAVVRCRGYVSLALVVVLAPVVERVSGLYRDEPYGRDVLEAAIERFWERVVGFRTTPGLVALIALGGVAEQLLLAAALWAALAGTGSAVLLLPILAVVPLPQVASVVPIPGSLGAYDVLLGGAIVLMTGAPAGAAAAAVLLVRTVSLPFGLAAGGVCAAFLRGWRP
jgi:hypothetical protein